MYSLCLAVGGQEGFLPWIGFVALYFHFVGTSSPLVVRPARVSSNRISGAVRFLFTHGRAFSFLPVAFTHVVD